jgi:hypothetical protein
MTAGQSPPEWDELMDAIAGPKRHKGVSPDLGVREKLNDRIRDSCGALSIVGGSVFFILGLYYKEFDKLAPILNKARDSYPFIVSGLEVSGWIVALNGALLASAGALFQRQHPAGFRSVVIAGAIYLCTSAFYSVTLTYCYHVYPDFFVDLVFTDLTILGSIAEAIFLNLLLLRIWETERRFKKVGL